MGILVSCCKGTSDELIPQPDAETRRRQQAEAAERRLRENESRGVKDPERVKRLERKAEELDRLEHEATLKGGSSGGAPLRWQMN